MDNYVEKLEYLIGLKESRKEPNKLEREEFSRAWDALIAAEGFSERAENMLYNGFRFCGARPFKTFMDSQRDKDAALKKLYHGKKYSENCAATTSLLFHLMGLCLNDRSVNLLVVNSLIEHIPAALKNKEGAIYGQADRALKKYLLDEIKQDVSIPEFQVLLDNGLRDSHARNFVNVMDEVLLSMNTAGLSTKRQKNISKIKVWMHSEKKISDNGDSEGTDVQETTDMPASSVVTDLIQESEDISKADSEKLPTDDINNALAIRLKKENDFVRREADMMRTKLHELQTDLDFEKKERKAREEQIAELTNDKHVSEKRIVFLEKEISKYKDEIEAQKEMIEMLRRDRTKQSSELTQRIASKLRTYYNDFIDAKDLEMSTDLGENMRDQLGEVFRILYGAGIAIK